MSLETLRDIPLTSEQLDSLVDVLRERQRQDAKWGEQNHGPLYWLGIVSEEQGEWAKTLIEPQASVADQRAELVHLVASALSALECHDRRERRKREEQERHMASLRVGQRTGWKGLGKP